MKQEALIARLESREFIRVRFKKIYSLEIKFETEKHCLRCPLRDNNSDGCNVQLEQGRHVTFENWEEQMKNCPMNEIH